MNVYYAKCVLYSYPHIQSIIDQIDDIVFRRAITSRCDYSPCVEIAERIIKYTLQKDSFMRLKIVADNVLEKFTREELDYFDYKYFKQKPREYFIGMDMDSRTYYRRQKRLVEKFADRLEKRGATDKWFDQTCMSIDYFKDMYRRVIEHEKKSMKNKPNKKKKSSGCTMKNSYKKNIMSA